MFNSIKHIFLGVLLSTSVYTHAQVGVGTTTPDGSAQLEVKSTSKGFLPPRVALTATNATAPITSPVAGLMVYNTATAGTAPNNVTPGFYYYDGLKWQRIINTPDATVNFSTANPNAGSPIFTGGPAATIGYIYLSSVDNSQWTYNGTTYVTYTAPASTAWNLSGGTNDAGANKTGDIYRTGKVGIGTTTPTAQLEIKAGVTNSSGLKFSDFNSTTPTSGGATLGVDASGNVVTVPGTSFSPSFGSSRISTTLNVGSGLQYLMTYVVLPTTGTYLINYTMRVQSMSAVSNQYAVGYLSNVSTPGTPIVGTEILGAFSGSPFVTGGNYSGSYIVTTTAANKVLYFMGTAQGGAMSFIDDNNGRTQISFVKVTP